MMSSIKIPATGVLGVALGHKSAMTPQLLNDEQYNIETASYATARDDAATAQ
jgi:hypothetical protein